MKILLIGGTGIISTCIANEATARGHEVWLLNRGNRPAFVANGARVIIGDANDPETEQKLAGLHFDVIADFIAFNTLGIAKHLDSYYKYCDQYIFISSATVYSRADQTTPIREGITPANNVDWEYCRGKIGAEKHLEFRRLIDDSFCYTIVRPYVTYGDTRIPFPFIPGKHWTIPYRIQNGKPIILPDTHNTCTLTHSEDFARAFLGLCKNEKAYCEDFHITSGCTYKWSDVADIIGDHLGKKPEFAYLPIETIARKFYPFYGDVYSQLKADKSTSWVFDNSKLLSVVPDFAPTHTLEDGIRQTLLAMQNSQTTGIDERWSGLCDELLAK